MQTTLFLSYINIRAEILKNIESFVVKKELCNINYVKNQKK